MDNSAHDRHSTAGDTFGSMGTSAEARVEVAFARMYALGIAQGELIAAKEKMLDELAKLLHGRDNAPD